MDMFPYGSEALAYPTFLHVLVFLYKYCSKHYNHMHELSYTSSPPTLSEATINQVH